MWKKKRGRVREREKRFTALQRAFEVTYPNILECKLVSPLVAMFPLCRFSAGSPLCGSTVYSHATAFFISVRETESRQAHGRERCRHRSRFAESPAARSCSLPGNPSTQSEPLICQPRPCCRRCRLRWTLFHHQVSLTTWHLQLTVISFSRSLCSYLKSYFILFVFRVLFLTQFTIRCIQLYQHIKLKHLTLRAINIVHNISKALRTSFYVKLFNTMISEVKTNLVLRISFLFRNLCWLVKINAIFLMKWAFKYIDNNRKPA